MLASPSHLRSSRRYAWPTSRGPTARPIRSVCVSPACGWAPRRRSSGRRRRAVPATLGARGRRAADSRIVDSEIRRLGDRNAIVEEQEISLGANLLAELTLRAPVAPQALPRLIVGVGIVDGHEHFQRVAIVDHPPALDDVELVGVRRAV